LTVAEFHSKLKATEVDIHSRADLSGSGSKSLALATTREECATNPAQGFSLSSLMTVTEVQIEMLGDEVLCLMTNHF
jgi:hypothetical protein